MAASGGHIQLHTTTVMMHHQTPQHSTEVWSWINSNRPFHHTQLLPSTTQESQRPPCVSRDQTSNRHCPWQPPMWSNKLQDCPILMTTDEVTSHSTGQQYQVRTNVSCKSSNVHFIQCKRSGTVCRQDWPGSPLVHEQLSNRYHAREDSRETNDSTLRPFLTLSG